MAKIVVVVSGLKGILFSSFGVLRRLEKDGHQVVLASPKNMKDWTEANGFQYLQLPNIFLNHTIPQRVYRKILTIISAQKALEKRVKDLKIDEIVDTFEVEQFDLLICDCELHEVILAAFKINLKTILLSPFFNITENHKVPIILSLSNPDEKSDFSTDWEELKEKEKVKESKRSQGNRKQALMEKAKLLNFPTKHWQQFTWPPPFAYVNFPTISLNLEQLDFYQEYDFFHYVGQTIFEERKSPVPHQFPTQYFLTKKEKGAKIILITLSTLKISEIEILNHLINIAKRYPDLEIIINDTADLKDKPENIHQFDFIPQLEVLKFADLSISRGGINTINECIYHKVPMIIIPGNRNDQNGNAARCFYHGIAMEANPSSLESSIQNCLNNDALKSSIENYHQFYQRYKESKRLEEVVNHYLMN